MNKKSLSIKAGPDLNKRFHKPILVKMETTTQYDAIKPLLDKLSAVGVLFDIYIPLIKDDKTGVNKMFNKTRRTVNNDGFKHIYRKVPDGVYKIALSAPHFESRINAKYYLKYYYGPVESKPDRLWVPSFQNHYHGVLLNNSRDAEVLSVYTKTYLLPILKYIGFKKKAHTDRNVLFLPTWDYQHGLGWVIEATKKIKKSGFRAIVKIHPSTGHDMDNKHSVTCMLGELMAVADEFYLGEKPLKELLAKSDVVVSDTSSAAFEAVYVGVPVVIFSKDVNIFNLGDIKSANAKYTCEGYISATGDILKLVDNIEFALGGYYEKRQSDLRNKLFVRDFTSGAVNKWLAIIEKYLFDDIDQDYIRLHDYYTSEYDNYIEQERNLREVLDKHIERERNLREVLEDERKLSVSQIDGYRKLLMLEKNPGVRVATRRLGVEIIKRLTGQGKKG